MEDKRQQQITFSTRRNTLNGHQIFQAETANYLNLTLTLNKQVQAKIAAGALALNKEKLHWGGQNSPPLKMLIFKTMIDWSGPKKSSCESSAAIQTSERFQARQLPQTGK